MEIRTTYKQSRNFNRDRKYKKIPWGNQFAVQPFGHYPTLCDSMACSTPGFPVYHQLPELAETHVHWVDDAIQPSHPLSVPVSFRLQSFPASGSFPVSVLGIKWPKYWSFSISPSNEYSGLISFRKLGWFDLLGVQGTQESFPTPQFKSINSLVLSFLYGPAHIHTWPLENP